MYVGTLIYMYVYVYIYIHTHTRTYQKVCIIYIHVYVYLDTVLFIDTVKRSGPAPSDTTISDTTIDIYK